MLTLDAHMVRLGVVIAGVVAFAVYAAGLCIAGYVPTQFDAYGLLLGIWAAGLVALMLWPVQVTYEGRVIARVLWCNLGVVTFGALVPHSLRLVLLVAPVFSIFYAALHLRLSQVIWITGWTWVASIVCSAILVSQAGLLWEWELLLSAGFLLVLGGALFLAAEVLRLRKRLDDRQLGMENLVGRMRDLAFRDELTGVASRRFIMGVLERQKALAERGQQFTLCYCDLDHFKEVNDEFGHAAGDAVLVQFASLASSVVRNIDYVARIGGEEFLLVLVGADQEAAEAVASRLRERTRALSVGEVKARSLSVSIGVTSHQKGETIEATLARADRALYDAKRHGRDRVVVAG